MNILSIISAIQWNDTIKMFLMSIISFALGVAISILIYEIIGKRKNHYPESYSNKEKR